MYRLFLLFLFCLGFQYLPAQRMTASEYIQQYKGLAIREMKRMGVPAAITLAQGLLETESGNSELVKSSNNHFGIKCKSTWTAESVSHDDDAAGECFRKYKSAEDSYRDHSNFLRGNSRYDALFKLNPADYKGWAYGLRKAGYATNPRYPEILIKFIEDNQLEQYTMEAIDEVPVFDASKYADDPVQLASLSETELDSTLTAPMKLIINGVKALYVPRGTSLLAIATSNEISLQKLLAINELSTDGLLEKGQYIFLGKKKKEGSADYCIARPGETLYDISQKYGVLLQSLYTFNDLNPDDFIVSGTKILLKPSVKLLATFSPEKGQVAGGGSVPSPAGNTVHRVLPKENLYGISKKYGVTLQQLRNWNNLTSDNLQIGQQLIISK